MRNLLSLISIHIVWPSLRNGWLVSFFFTLLRRLHWYLQLIALSCLLTFLLLEYLLPIGVLCRIELQFVLPFASLLMFDVLIVGQRGILSETSLLRTFKRKAL